MAYDPGLGIIQDEANRESKRTEIEMEKAALEELHYPSPPESNVTQANIASYIRACQKITFTIYGSCGEMI
jgi:hypothetical protein